jgi:hypothetical protein
MPRRLRLSQRFFTAARWPLGVLVTGWDYLWRTTPMHRCEEAGSAAEDLPPPLPPQTDRTDLQGVEDGVGPLMHRRYTTRVREAKLDAEQLIAAFAGAPNRATPTALARFVKLRGDDGELRVGDEFTVRMPGPWDGPVRVVEAQPRRFGFATLDGHLEAGQIEWGAADLDDGVVEFRIESWAAPGDRVSNAMHHRLRMAKEVQLHMWTSVHERVVKRCGGRLTGGIDIDTRIVEG